MFILCCFPSQTCTNVGRLCGEKTLRGLKGAYTRLHGSPLGVYLVESQMLAVCVCVLYARLIPNVSFKSQGKSDVVLTQSYSEEIGAPFSFSILVIKYFRFKRVYLAFAIKP